MRARNLSRLGLGSYHRLLTFFGSVKNGLFVRITCVTPVRNFFKAAIAPGANIIGIQAANIDARGFYGIVGHTKLYKKRWVTLRRLTFLFV